MLDMYDLAVTKQFMINVVVPEKNYLEMYTCSQLHIPDLNHNWSLWKKKYKLLLNFYSCNRSDGTFSFNNYCTGAVIQFSVKTSITPFRGLSHCPPWHWLAHNCEYSVGIDSCNTRLQAKLRVHFQGKLLKVPKLVFQLKHYLWILVAWLDKRERIFPLAFSRNKFSQ